jgi:hypothetical protein
VTDRPDERLEQHYAAMRAEEDVRAPADLVNRAVLRAVVERQRASRSRTVWGDVRRALRPRIVRLRLAPVTGLAVAVAVVTAALLANTLNRPRSMGEELAVATGESASPQVGSQEGQAGLPVEEAREVPVRFVLPAEGARSVAVAGDFNGWQVGEVALTDPEGDGVFAATVWLRPGTYAYMFVVDGERWVTDPYASNFRDDGFGQKNAVLRID